MFKHVNKIKDTKDKKFFIEKINLFIKLIKVFAQKNNLIDSSLNSVISDATKKRLKELKIIESNSEDEQKLLYKILKKPTYEKFIKAINYNIKYKKLIGNLMDNLDQVKEKLLENSSTKARPRIVDFFCGAGGLSLGFSQEDFLIDLANDYDDVVLKLSDTIILKYQMTELF